MQNTVLVVDDEPVQRRLLDATLQKLGYAVHCVESGAKAIDLLTGNSGDDIKAVLLDLMMPEMDGIAVLETMQRQGLMRPVIVQTAQGGVETAVTAMRAGAVDFVVKPAAPQRLKTSLENALKADALRVEVKGKKKKSKKNARDYDIVSASQNMEEVKTIAKKAAKSNIPVMIGGESGTGKELIARTIQGMSDRASSNLVIVNCGALPENLAESILFGHEKGSFTGASEKHVGKFREADGGTLFLDEVGELPADIQVKLLRALQEGEIDPVGAAKSVKVDVRIISATNRDLLSDVKEGKFREDLYYRLNVLPLNLPPLRERKEDIPALVEHFLKRLAAREKRKSVLSIDRKALSMLSNYDWPGNIRQLENAMFRAIILCEGDTIGIDEFPQIAMEMDPSALSVTPSIETPDGLDLVEELVAVGVISESAVVGGSNTLNLLSRDGEVLPLHELEKHIMQFALNHHDGKMSKVAKCLGIGRSTLYRKLQAYGLEIDENA
ncbi:MAG: sigma-54 dependent transcriptional regulator [Pseudomonadota bacterium]